MSDPLDNDFFFTQPPPGNRGGPKPLLRFFTEAVELPGKSAEAGRPVYEDRDFVGITNPGSRDEVVRIAKDKAKQDEYVAWAYAKWKRTQEQIVDGTPLETVPFLSKAQVLELRAMNIPSLEALAELPDGNMRFMGAVELKKKARAYIEAAKDSAVVTKLTHELEQRDNKIDLLEKQMAEMNARFEKLLKEAS